jgi:hypothetical protein
LRLTPETAEAFIRANTALAAPPHVPEIRLHLADEAHELWKKTEEELAEIGLPPPFWAFACRAGKGSPGMRWATRRWWRESAFSISRPARGWWRSRHVWRAPAR